MWLSEGLTAVFLKIQVIWDLTLCHCVSGSWHFAATLCPAFRVRQSKKKNQRGINKGNDMCVVWSISGWQSLLHCLIYQFWIHQPCGWLLVGDQTVLRCTSNNVPFLSFLTFTQLARQPFWTDTDHIYSPLLFRVGCFSWTAWALKMKARRSFEMSGTTHLVTLSYPTGP